MVAFTLLCARLSYPERLKTLIHPFGHSRSWISTIFNNIIMHLSRRYYQTPYWSRRLTYTKTLNYSIAIKDAGGSHCFWSFIDGTANFICRSTDRGNDKQRVSYSGHKHQHQFQSSCIVTPDSLIIIQGPFVGRRSDWSMIQDSNLRQYLHPLNKKKKFHERLWLYCDPAYQEL